MELDEFKLRWTKNLAADHSASMQKNELDSVFSDATTMLTQLTKTTKFWRNLSLTGVVLLILLSVGTAVLYLFYPDRLQSLTNAMPVITVLIFFIILIGWLYYKQARIFEVYYNHNMGSAIRQVINRFTAWYR